VYEEDYPDVLSGAQTLWSYEGGGGAAVGEPGAVLVIGFGIETMVQGDLIDAMGEILDWMR